MALPRRGCGLAAPASCLWLSPSRGVTTRREGVGPILDGEVVFRRSSAASPSETLTRYHGVARGVGPG